MASSMVSAQAINTASRLSNIRCVPMVSRRKALRVQAQLNNANKPAIAKYADSIGLPTDEGLFGFRPFSEVWCGRLAMMGFVTSIIEEVSTGRGTLAQIGLMDGSGSPSYVTLYLLIAIFGLGTAAATGNTIYRVKERKMSMKEMNRYRSFLGLRKEDEASTKAAVRDMKAGADFTRPNVDYGLIAESKAAGTPADQFLSTSERPAEEEAQKMKASSSLLTLTKAQEEAEVMQTRAEQQQMSSAGPSISLQAREDIEEQLYFSQDAQYARGVELTNGRWAMVGFLAAILVEAATGKGIVLQLIMYFKAVGLLGPMSGF